MSPWTQVALAFGWGGLMALERRAFLQAMFSRPIVSAAGLGYLMGDTASGLFVGMVLELFFLGAASLGASLPEHETLAATGTAAGAVALVAGGSGTPASWAAAILLFAGLGIVGKRVERFLDRFASRRAHRAAASAHEGHIDAAMRQNLWAMGPHFWAFGALTAMCAVVGFALAPAFAQLPLPLVRGLAWSFPAMGSVAAAIAVRSARARRGALVGGLSAALVALAAAGASIWRGFP